MRKESYLEKSLPHNEEAEDIILGAILIDNNFFDTALSFVDPDDFYNPLNRQIFAVMRRVYESGKEIHPINMAEDMKLHSEVFSAGTSYITNKTLGLPHFSDISEFLQTVKNHSVARKTIRICTTTIQDLINGEDPVEDVMGDLESKFLKASTELYSEKKVESKPFSSLAEIIPRMRDQFEAYNRNDKFGVQCGMKEVDDLLDGGGFQPGGVYLVGAAEKSGKAQPLYCLILTPEGFTTMKQVKVGMSVVSKFGTVEKVTHVYPQGKKTSYEMVLRSGATTECCLEHLWEVQDEDGVVSVVPFYEIVKNRRRFRIPTLVEGKMEYERISLITKLYPVEMQCITVTGPSGTYVTDDFIVTHNTSIVLDWAYHVARNIGLTVPIVTLEMAKITMAKRLYSAHTGIPYYTFRPGMGGSYYNKAIDELDSFGKIPINISDKINSIDQLWRHMEKQVELGVKTGIPVGMGVLDYLQLFSMAGSSKNASNRTEEVSKISRSIKVMASELEIPLVVISNLNRMGLTEGQEPDTFNLRDSGSLAFDAEAIFFLHNPSYVPGKPYIPKPITDMTLILSRQRNGPTGRIPVKLIGAYMQFMTESQYRTHFGDTAKDNPIPQSAGQKITAEENIDTLWAELEETKPVVQEVQDDDDDW